VFVVEQTCPYPELDGRDTEPGTVHLWSERDGAPAAYLRILDEPGGPARIGRVCTAAWARGAGLAGALLDAAVDSIGDRECLLSAQSHLIDFYARHGFVADGAEFLEDGIPHTPMARRVPDGRPAHP
jgi:ElaA protein